MKSMKKSLLSSRTRFSGILRKPLSGVFIAAIGVSVASAQAVTLTWDGDTNYANGITDVSGTWGASTPWRDVTSGTNVAWTNNSDVVFTGVSNIGYTVTVASPVTTGNILITNGGSGGVNIGAAQANSIVLGGVLNMSGSATPNVLVTASLSGTGSLVVNSGYINLQGQNTFSGGTTLNSGTLGFAGGAQNVSTATYCPVGSGTLTINGGTVSQNLYGSGNIAIKAPIYLGGNFVADGFSSSGAMDLGGSIRTITSGVNGSSFSGVISNGGIIIAGSKGASLTNGTSNFTQGVTVAPYSALTISGSSTGPVGAPTRGPLGTGTLTLSQGSTISYTGASSYSLGNAIAVNGDIFLNSNNGYYSGPMDLGGANRTLTFFSNNATVLSGAISNGGLNLSAIPGTSGNVSLTSTNSTFSGGVTLNPYMSLTYTGNSVGTSGAATRGPLGTGTFTINGGSLTSTNPANVYNPVAIAGNFFFTPDSGSFWYGPVTLSGTSSLTVVARYSTTTFSLAGGISGSGGVTFTGSNIYPQSRNIRYQGATANTYTGLTTIEMTALGSASNTLYLEKTGTATGIAGDLLITAGAVSYNGAGTNQIADASTVTINGPTARFDLAASHSDTVGQVTLDGGGSITGSGNSTLSTTAPTYEFKSGTVTANLSGTGSVAMNKTTAGLVTLSGTNTYNGPTTVSGGMLHYATKAALYSGSSAKWTDSNITVASGATLGLSVGGTTGFSATDVDAIKALGTATTGFMDGSNLGLESAVASGTYSGIIADTNGGANHIGLTKLGTNTLTLTGENTYTGVTTVNSGVLNFGNTGALYGGAPAKWTEANITVANGATLALTVGGATGFSSADVDTIKALGTATTGFTNGSRLGLDTSNGDFTYGSIIADTNAGANSIGLNKLGSNTLTLSAANTFTGSTTVTSGTILLTNSLALQNSLLANGGTGIVFDAASVPSHSFTVGGLSGTAGLALQDNAANAVALTLNPGAGVTGTYAGVISVAGGSITKTGSGLQVLSGSNTYGGTTTVSAGTLQFGKKAALYTGVSGNWTAANITVASGATLALNVGGANEFVAADLDIIKALGTATTGFLNGSNLGLDTTGTNGANGALGIFTYASVIADTNGGANHIGLTKLGSNTLALTSASSSYTGVTTVSGGVLSIGAAGKLTNGGVISSIGAATNSASNLILNGGILQFLGTPSTTTDRLFTLTANGGGLDASQGTSYSLTFAGNGAGAANAIAFSGSGARTLTLTGNNSTANTLAPILGDGIGGATSVSKTNSGRWQLTGVNTYTGVTTISGGILGTGTSGTLANGGVASSIGSSSNAASNLILDGGTLQHAGTGASTDRLFTLTTNGGTLDASGLSNAAVTFSGNGVGAANAIAYAGTGVRTLTLTGASTGANTLAPVLADGPGGVTYLTKTGAGKWILTGANTYTGVTTVSQGELQLNTTGAQAIMGDVVVGVNAGVNLPTLKLMQSSQINTASKVDVINGTFDIQTFNQTLAGVQLIWGNINGTTGTLTSTSDYDVQGGSISAVLAGNVGLVKSINGTTTTLSGKNLYTGATTVNAGKLYVTGSLGGTSGVAVNNAGSILQLGASNLIQNTATLSLADGTLDVNGKVQTLGALTTLSGSSNIVLGLTTASLTIADSSAQTWTGTLTIQNWSAAAFDATGNNHIYFGTDGLGLIAGQISQISFLNPTINGVVQDGIYHASLLDSGELVAALVPEPGSVVLVVMGGIAVLTLSRRRKA